MVWGFSLSQELGVNVTLFCCAGPRESNSKYLQKNSQNPHNSESSPSVQVKTLWLQVETPIRLWHWAYNHLSSLYLTGTGHPVVLHVSVINHQIHKTKQKHLHLFHVYWKFENLKTDIFKGQVSGSGLVVRLLECLYSDALLLLTHINFNCSLFFVVVCCIAEETPGPLCGF